MNKLIEDGDKTKINRDEKHWMRYDRLHKSYWANVELANGKRQTERADTKKKKIIAHLTTPEWQQTNAYSHTDTSRAVFVVSADNDSHPQSTQT